MKTKRYKNMIIVCTVFLLGLSYANQNEDVLAKKENILLTAQLIIGELKNNIKNANIDEEFLCAEMNGNSKIHKNTSESKRFCREKITTHIVKEYEKEVIQVLERLDFDKPEGIESWFDQKEREKLLNPEKAIESKLDKHFEQAYKKARKKVCDEQISRLIGDVYPTEVEIDTFDPGKLREKLLELLLKKQKEHVFQENIPLLSKNIIDPILNDAFKQKKEQAKIVEKSTGGNAIYPAEIQATIRKEIEKYRQDISKLKVDKKDMVKVYGIFPSVEEKSFSRSEQIAGNKLVRYIKYSTFPIGYQELLDIIKKDFPNHIHIEDSHKLCCDEFSSTIKKQVIAQYSKNITEPGKNKFRIFLEKIIANNNECHDALKKLIERSIKDNFRKVRDDISKEQINKIFSPLETLPPDYELIDGFYDKVTVEISHPFSIEGISAEPFDQSILLDETKSFVVETEKKLIQEGLEALRKQMRIVEEVEPQVESRLESGNILPTVEQLSKSFTEKIQYNWSSDMLSKKYTNLFPRVISEIERRSKSLLAQETRRKEIEEQLQKEKIIKQSPPAKPGIKPRQEEEKKPNLSEHPRLSNQSGSGIGAGGQGEGTHEGREVKEGNVIPEIVVDLDYENGLIITDLIFIGDNIKSVRFVLTGDLDSDQTKLSQIQQIYKTWLSQIKKDQEIDIYVLTRIFDRKVFYGVVFDIRECLEKAIIDLHVRKMVIHYFDCLARKEDKEKFSIPSEFKEKSMTLQK